MIASQQSKNSERNGSNNSKPEQNGTKKVKAGNSTSKKDETDSKKRKRIQKSTETTKQDNNKKSKKTKKDKRDDKPKKKETKKNDEPLKVDPNRPWDAPGFEPITENYYVERKHVKLPFEDIAVCHCVLNRKETPCGSQCINRMTFMECTRGTCPCGKECTNQRFQRKQYAKSIPFRTEKKGWGLKVLQDLKKGDFVIEYIGEVISNDLCLERMRRNKSDKNFYYLTLDANECIDARRKGNTARFINHSCKPNCQTQKWSVLGETRVGMFAIENIKAGTELTFDYQFERFGVKKQKCYCGEDNCRGYLGEKPKQIAVKKEAAKAEKAQQEYMPKIPKSFIADHAEFVNDLISEHSICYSKKNLSDNNQKTSQGYVNSKPPTLKNLPFLARNVRLSATNMLWEYLSIKHDEIEELEDESESESEGEEPVRHIERSPENSPSNSDDDSSDSGSSGSSSSGSSDDDDSDSDSSDSSDDDSDSSDSSSSSSGSDDSDSSSSGESGKEKKKKGNSNNNNKNNDSNNNKANSSKNNTNNKSTKANNNKTTTTTTKSSTTKKNVKENKK